MSEENLLPTLQAYQRLVEIARDLASTLDLDTLLKRIVCLAADLNAAEEASILLYDSKKQQLRFQSSTDLDNAIQMKGIIIPAESIAGWVALHRQPVIVTDVHSDSRFFRNIDQLLQFNTRSIVAVPMISKDELIGVLEVLNKRSDTFTPFDQEILMVLAGQAAVAIENTRLFHQSDLIAELVHELRTPLSSINTITYLLQRQGISETQRIALALTIQNEAGRLNDMSTSFLDLARLESGRSDFQIIYFNSGILVREVCEIIQPRAEEREIKLETDIAADLPDLAADRDKIKQVLLNLLNNAVKYNRPGGMVTIRLRGEKDQLEFTIQDSGRGIPVELLPHLFEKFFRANPNDPTTPGTGLGLYICKKIIENHGGQIRASSQENVGTTFTFNLPLNPS
jgi:signal transduction histidine kinase